MVLGYIHTYGLEFIVSLIVYAFHNPAENAGFRAVAPHDSYLSGDRLAACVYAIEIQREAAALLHRYHKKNITLIHIKVIKLALTRLRNTQKFLHALIHIGYRRLLFAGVFYVSEVQRAAEPLYLRRICPFTCNIRQH